MEIRSNGPALELVGDFDARSTAEVRRALYRHLDAVDDAVVDLTEVPAADVTALKVLAAASFRAGRNGHHLRIRGCRPGVRRLMHVSRLARVLEVEREAIPA